MKYSAEMEHTLAELYEAERVRDQPILASLQERNVHVSELSNAEKDDWFRDAFISVPREVGDFLYILATVSRSRRIVEFGTSYGLSTMYLAAAAEVNDGDVVTTEKSIEKSRQARLNLERAGLSRFVTIETGDAEESLRQLTGPVDMLFMDGWKSQYLPVLQVVEPLLSHGAVVVAANMAGRPPDVPLLDYLSDRFHFVRTHLGHNVVVATPLVRTSP